MRSEIGADPLVSVVTPLYNSAGFVERTLESIRDQIYPHWEAILVDDGSTDATWERVQRFLVDARFRYTRQENRGIAGARNTGIKMALGGWICFLDHDDRWLPEKLIKQVRIAQSGLYDVLFTDAVIITEHKRTLYSTNFGPRIVQQLLDMKSEGSMTPVLISMNPILNSSVMVRAELFARFGLLDPVAVPAEDYDFWLRCTNVARFHYVPEPLTEYYQHGQNYSENRDRLLRSIIVVLDKNRDALPHEYRAAIEDELDKWRRQHLMLLFKMRDWRRAAHEVIELSTRPRGLRSVIRVFPAKELILAARRRMGRMKR